MYLHFTIMTSTSKLDPRSCVSECASQGRSTIKTHLTLNTPSPGLRIQDGKLEVVHATPWEISYVMPHHIK